ncbi:WD repeat-containing protein 27-like [Branchiostoma floridae]|uniref:WD repeat-containing protein 27-like n=1 Tax=Branchiostoma floridae TaxID=7739 RepID=A0A9J7N382_BRAFL|nr:WD repeat-containing protein 27-like [Branchiostoma floridae]
MSAVLELTIPTVTSPSHTQLSCNGTYLAVPHGKGEVGVWSLQDLGFRQLDLVAHKKAVTATSFGFHSQPTLLCTAAEDYIIVWNIEEARHMYEKGQQIRGQIIGQVLGYVQHVSFSPDDALVAACIGSEILILDSQVERLHSTLEGHNSIVTSAEFCPHHKSTIVSISEDRTFKVWDLENSSLIYQSTIISAFPFLSMSHDPTKESFAVGTSDGQVRIYDLSDGSGFRQLHQVDIGKTISKWKTAKEDNRPREEKGPVTVSSRPTWQKPPSQDPVAQDSLTCGDSEASAAVIGLHYCRKLRPRQDAMKHTAPNFLGQDSSLVDNLLDVAPVLIVGTTNALVFINAHTFETTSLLDFEDYIPSMVKDGPSQCNIPLAGSFAFAQGADKQQVWCLVGSLFQKSVDVLRLTVPAPEGLVHELESLSLSSQSVDDGASGEGGTAEISVLSSTPLAENSPLRSELVPRSKETSSGRQKQRGHLVTKPKGQGGDQPLTFKSKIKSSGYTQAPRMKMFTPSTRPTKGSLTSRAKPTGGDRPGVREFPMESGPPISLQKKLEAAERPTPINSITFSDDGTYLACGLANKSALVLKMPGLTKPHSITGHNAAVTSVNWSKEGRWLLTASDDKTASVWTTGQSEPILTFSSTNHNFAVDKDDGKLAAKENRAFPHPVRHAQFYYMDKFILLTCGSAISMFKYHLDPTKDDIKRYQPKSRYKLVKTFTMEKTQHITALSAVNGFYSYIVLCAGSNKSMEVFDMNVARSIRTIPDAHTRPVHAFCQNKGSPFVSHPSSAYDLFLTSALTDGIKLWDLRTNRCVRRYEGHLNRAYPCGLTMSPCARFIATGAEDKSAYIYDVRESGPLHKLTGHTDVVSDVAFHPHTPQLVTSSVDGKLHSYVENR